MRAMPCKEAQGNGDCTTACSEAWTGWLGQSRVHFE